MDAIDHWFKAHLKEVSRDECLALLGCLQVGRIAFVDSDGPVALPVNYAVDGECILIATTPWGSVARHATGKVAFEVDEIDEFNEAGWSVLVRGTASVVPPGDGPREKDRPNPWPEGPRDLLLKITPHSITGRRLLSA